MNKLHTRRRRVLASVGGFLVVAVIVGAITGIKAMQFDAMATAAAGQTMPAERVNVVEARVESRQPRLAAVGSINAVQGTVISAEAEGVVRDISFEAGSTVEAGEVLARLDADVEEAQLRAAEAAAERARLSFVRAKNLLAENSISNEEYDAAESNLKQSDAQVDNIRALIARKVVRAPFTGKLGIRRISIGQYLEKGSPVVALHSLDPVYVDFSLPQQQLADLHEGLAVAVASDAYPDRGFAGNITAIDPNIDPATRNVRIQATLTNPEHRLRPGMFVSVDVVLSRSEDVLVIPATAVMHAPFGDSVFIVEQAEQGQGSGLTVRQQVVRLGDRHGDFVVATDGIAAGDEVVASGVFKLRPGMPVVVDNELRPVFSMSPRPDNT